MSMCNGGEVGVSRRLACTATRQLCEPELDDGGKSSETLTLAEP